jgi:hypothetical protein
MITCDLRGGLGNQIFQIFATISYSNKSKNPFKFMNISTLGDSSVTIRNFFGSNDIEWVHNIVTNSSVNI